MKRGIEDALALVVVIVVPSALLWLLGYSYGALQEAEFHRAWSAEAQAGMWLVATVGGLAVLLYVIRQLMRAAQHWAWTARR